MNGWCQRIKSVNKNDGENCFDNSEMKMTKLNFMT